MIVRPSPPHLLFITQPDHAALAARLMAHWRADGRPRPAARELALAATEVHDIGWTTRDAAPSVEAATGEPFDFLSAPDEVKQAVWPEALDRLDDQPAIAALVAHHAVTVYRRHRGDPPWEEFFRAVEGRRRALRRRAAVPGWRVDREVSADPLFLRDYRTLFLGDLLSLVFCNGWTDAVEENGYRIVLRGDRLLVTPDPFGGADVPLEVPARRLPDRRYLSDEDLRDEWAAAPAVTVSGVARGSA